MKWRTLGGRAFSRNGSGLECNGIDVALSALSDQPSCLGRQSSVLGANFDLDRDGLELAGDRSSKENTCNISSPRSVCVRSLCSRLRDLIYT